LLPPTKEQLAILLDSHLLEKALYELGYEFHHRPDWLRIPLGGILRLLNLTDSHSGRRSLPMNLPPLAVGGMIRRSCV